MRAVDKIFTELNINRLADWERLGGRAGVGLTSTKEVHVDPLWTDKQLGLLDGTTPRALRNGDKAMVDYEAVMAAREVFDVLLGPISGELQPERPIIMEQPSSMHRPTPHLMPKMKTGGVPLNKNIVVPSTILVSA